jgi:glycosyltransferase involved in cell wall biosynthesis
LHRDREVWVVVPAHDEEALIARTLRGIPAFVDRIVVVDDASADGTAAEAARVGDRRARIVRRLENGGVGAAIVDGYRIFLSDSAPGAACAVMAGDAQMDPADLPALLEGLDRGADYVKGNRFAKAGTFRAMPLVRYLGNRALSFLTRLVTGYRRLGDAQCGYTVIAREALAQIDLASLYPRYGFPNDLLIKLSRAGARVGEAPVRAIYAGEASGLNPLVAGPRILGIIWRGWRENRTAGFSRPCIERSVADRVRPAEAGGP